MIEQHISSCPRFAAQDEYGLLDTEALGAMFWAACRAFGAGVATELRLETPSVGQTEVYVRTYRIDDSAVPPPVQPALPTNFKTRDVKHKPPRVEDADVSSWAIVRRRCTLLPIPGDVYQIGNHAPILQVAEAEPEVITAFLGAPDNGSAVLPDGFVIPRVAPIKEDLSSRTEFFRSLQASAPNVVSITCSRPPLSVLRGDRDLARGHWCYMLRGALNLRLPDGTDSVRACHDLWSSGAEGVAEETRAVLSRYWASEADLSAVRIRVGSDDPARTAAISTSFAACLGGPRVMEVLPKHRVPGRTSAYATGDEAEWARDVQAWATERGIAQVESNALQRFVVGMFDVVDEQEAAIVMRLPMGSEAGLPGVVTHMVPPFHATPTSFRNRDHEALAPTTRSSNTDDQGRTDLSVRTRQRIVLGHVDNASGPIPHQIVADTLRKHALIVGTTGSGKTVTTLQLVRQLQQLDPPVPLLVIEPTKTEYVDDLRRIGVSVHRQRFEAPTGKLDAEFVRIDPMRLLPGVSVARHTSYLKSCFEAAFAMPEFMAGLMATGLVAYYTSTVGVGGCGLSMLESAEVEQAFVRPRLRKRREEVDDEVRETLTRSPDHPGLFPSFTTFVDYFTLQFLPNEKRRLGGAQSRGSQEAMAWIRAFERRLEGLQARPLGMSFAHAEDRLIHICRQRAGEQFKQMLAKGGFDLRGEAFARHAAELRHPFLNIVAPQDAGVVVLELDAIPDPEEKALAMAMAMTSLFETRQGRDLLQRRAGNSDKRYLEHVTIVEEAHRLLARDSGASRSSEVAGASASTRAASIFCDMLAEVRALGEGLVIVEQIPTKIASEAVKNTNLKLMHRLAALDDREYLGEAMNLDEAKQRFVTNLEVGQLVAFEENLDEPTLLRVSTPET